MSVQFDQLDRFTFDNHPVRGELVRIRECLTELFERQQYPQPIRHLLGEMMAATALLTATLKFEGEVSLQIQSKGIVKYIVVSSNHQLELRGVARYDEDVSVFPDQFEDWFVQGVLVITLTPNNGERYQGVVALDKPSLAQCLEDYFLRSEQLYTKIQFSVVDTDIDTLISGWLLQVIPQQSESTMTTSSSAPGERVADAVEGVDKSALDSLNHLAILAETISSDEWLRVPTEQLLYRMFHNEQTRLYSPTDIRYQCSCSRQRSASALSHIDKQELLSIIEEQGEIATQCEFCGASYIFDAIDVAAIHSDTGMIGEDERLN